ncbi:MAG: helix-turn-helix domain-containing protein [Desulfovibrio sp.]|nr:helix-turn-helix domain-containing protein [Desulfovibrio sp.]
MTAFPHFYRCLGETIRTNRKKAAVSQMVLAERAGVTRRFIQELENGRSNISLHTLMRLSAALGMTLSDMCAQIETALKS